MVFGILLSNKGNVTVGTNELIYKTEIESWM